MTSLSAPRDDRRTGNDLLWLGLIVGLALVVRIVYILQMRDSPLFADPILDAELHVRWARAILDGQTLFEEAYFRAPLYPGLLSLIYRVFGDGFLAPRIIQAVIGSMSCGLIYLLGRDAFGRSVGVVAGLLAALNWVMIYFDGELLLEGPGNFLNLLSIWFLFRSRTRNALVWIGLSGLMLGLSAINRPNVLALMPLFAGWLVLRDRLRWRQGLVGAFIYLLGCAIPIAPITVRNWVVGHDFVLIASQGGTNFYIGNNEHSDGMNAVMPGARRDWWGGYQDWIAMAEQAEGRSLKPSEVSAHYFQKSRQFFREQPVNALNLMFRKFQIFWYHLEITNNENLYFYTGHYAPIMKYLPAGFGLVGPLALVGMWHRRRDWLAHFPIWGFALGYSATVIAFFVNTRFRVPVVPFLIVYAGVAIVEIVRLFRTSWVDRSSVRPLGGVLLGLVIVWYAINRGGMPEGYGEDANSYCQIGLAYHRQGKPALAREAFEQAATVDPQCALAEVGLADLAVESHELEKAVDHYLNSILFDPVLAPYDRIGVTFATLARWSEAIKAHEQGIQVLPGHLENQRRLAYLLATCPAPEYRDGRRAVELAQIVIKLGLTGSEAYDTLAVALAETGRFDEAVDAGSKALELAKKHDSTNFAIISAHLAAFRSGKPFHEGGRP
jgi:4-amino-4-deoxy-L-arabinose transferase-like glycosyltransferase